MDQISNLTPIVGFYSKEERVTAKLNNFLLLYFSSPTHACVQMYDGHSKITQIDIWTWYRAWSEKYYLSNHNHIQS